MRGASIGRWPWAIVQPATSRVVGQRRRRRRGSWLPASGDELDAAVGQPARQRGDVARRSAGRGGATRPGRPRRPAGRSRPGRAGATASPASRPASARGRSRPRGPAPTRSRGGRRRSPRAARPGGPPPLRGRAARGRSARRASVMTIRARAVSRAWSRRRASAGDSNWSGSAAPGSIQAAANGERAASDAEPDGRPARQPGQGGGVSSRSSSTSRRVSRSRGWSGQAALTSG